MNREELEQIIAKETGKGNFTGPVELKEADSFGGVIHNFDAPRISIQYDPDYEQKTERLSAFPDRAEKVARALIRHEINHKKYAPLPGAPGNLDTSIELLEVIAEELKQAGFANVPTGTQGHTLYSYMNNMFADFLDNSQLGLSTDHSGAFLLYHSQGSERLSPLFDAFVSMQEAIYGRKQTKRILRKLHSKDPRVKDAVKNFFKEAGCTPQHPEKIYDQKSWKEMAKIFTKQMIPLIDKSQLGDPNYLQQTFKELETDAFPAELEDPETQMGIVWKRYMEGEAEGTKEAFHAPAFMDANDALLLLYQRLARNLEIRVRNSTETSSMPLTRYARAPFNPEVDDIRRAQVGFSGRLHLSVRPYAIEQQIEYEQRPSELPEINLAILDTSGSTQSNLGKKTPLVLNPWQATREQWTDDSIYHHELLSWFGLVEYLRKQGSLRKTAVRLANFSSQTEYASDLDAAYKLALTPQFRGTVLDPREIFRQTRKKALTFTLSDGAVENWEEIKENFMHHAKGHFYFHIQIGEATTMSSDLEANGFPVYYDDGSSVARKVIDLTRPYVAKGKAVRSVQQ